MRHRILILMLCAVFSVTCATMARADAPVCFGTGGMCEVIGGIVHTALNLPGEMSSAPVGASSSTLLSPAIPMTPPASADNRPLIAIVIDDVGVDVKRSARAINELPPQVTMSFLPYARDILKQVAMAKAKGHEIMVHMPMQPLNPHIDPGPNYLGTQMPLNEILRRALINLNTFNGYVGVNNHMGSKFTQDAKGLAVVMGALKGRHVFFLDSLTIAKSVAEKVARAQGIETTHRNIFIDHDEDKVHVDKSLEKIERVARVDGNVIAIGHPKDKTLAELEHWLPTLQAKGFRLATVPEVIAMRDKERLAQAESQKKKSQ